MFRLIDLKNKIIYYNYKENGFDIIPYKKTYKVIKTNDSKQKDLKKNFLVSIDIGLTDIHGRLLYTEDVIEFMTEQNPFCIGVIKYINNIGFAIKTPKNKIININNAYNITLSDDYNDPLSGQYL